MLKFIQNLLSPIKLPVSGGAYRGKNEEYITVDIDEETPEVCGDDVDIIGITSLQINYFTKGTFQKNKKKIRRLLRLGGFVINSTKQIYENDTGYWHVVILCEKEYLVNDEEESEEEEE